MFINIHYKDLSMRNLLLISAILSSSLLAMSPTEVESLAEKKCNKCHLIGKLTKDSFKEIKAPPAWGIAKKVKLAYPDRLKGIEYIVNYAINPSPDKMLFPKETIKRFGHMPSQKGKVTKEELREIAKYILDK